MYTDGFWCHRHSRQTPVSISEKYPYHTGLDIEPIGRLAYLPGEMVNINGEKISICIRFHCLIWDKEKAYPGCVGWWSKMV